MGDKTWTVELDIEDIYLFSVALNKLANDPMALLFRDKISRTGLKIFDILVEGNPAMEELREQLDAWNNEEGE